MMAKALWGRDHMSLAQRFLSRAKPSNWHIVGPHTFANKGLVPGSRAAVGIFLNVFND